jgi:choline dehydrogenase
MQSDYLVVGGGTAGCILAARLSENPAVNVTLLEAGPEDRNIWIHIPAGYARLFRAGTFDWKFATEAEPELGGRSIAWPRGKVLGGSGSINGMVYLRGSPHDYDRWAQAGARGWSYDDVLPAFKRFESWQGVPSENRGKDGPVSVCELGRLSPGATAFIAACQAMGFARNPDVNAGAIDGVFPTQTNMRRGRRHSTAQAFLRPARSRKNLRVFTGVTARKLLFGDGRATGVEAQRDDGTVENFSATREVIICSGAISTPVLLMLSGIGDPAVLSAMGLPVVAAAPEVGQNLQDHFLTRFGFRTRPAKTLNEITASRISLAAALVDYAIRRDGPLAVGASEAHLFARVMPGAEEADVQMQFLNFCLAGANYELADHPGVTINFDVCRPDSRGMLTLRGPDPREKPVIRPNYLSDARDAAVMVQAARLLLRIAATEPFAGLVEAPTFRLPDKPDDEDLMGHIRATGSTVYHPCGTCRMGSDERAVVDPQLRVRGIGGLRIADASVMPLVPSSNIQPAVMMIAERAAQMIAA